jgi:toluene monooxygenase system protein E
VLFLEQLEHELSTVGATLDALIVGNLWLDAQRSQRWTQALLRFLVDAAPGNHAILQDYLDQWVPRGRAMLDGGSRLLAQAGGRSADEITDAAVRSWQSLLEPVGLSVTPA